MRCRPYQIERPGTRFAFAQPWPRFGGVFDRQPGTCRPFLQQWGGGHFGSKTIQGHGLQVGAGAYPLQQRSQGDGPIVHGALIGNVLLDADGLGLRMVKQLGAVPLARRVAQLQVQLRRRHGQAKKQGE
ncbi:hypothetical protein D3C81_1738880 [compost metagenome]